MKKKEIFVIRDFNLECLNCNDKIGTKNFYHNLSEHVFNPHIHKPTGVCKKCATIIDKIPVNCIFDYTFDHKNRD